MTSIRFRTSNTCLRYIFNDVVVWPFGKVLFHNQGEFLHAKHYFFNRLPNCSNTALNTIYPLDYQYASENRTKDTRLFVLSCFSNLFNWLISRHKDLSSLIKDKMVSLLLIWLKILRMKNMLFACYKLSEFLGSVRYQYCLAVRK